MRQVEGRSRFQWRIRRNAVLPVPPGESHRKHRALADFGAQLDVVTQEVGEPLDDGQSQAQTLAPVTLRILQLRELPENLLVAIPGNAPAAVPDLDANAVAAAAAAQHHAAPVCVADCIGQEIPDDPREQRGVAADVDGRLHHDQRQPLLPGNRCVLEAQSVEDAGQRDGRDMRLHDPRVEPRDVQKRVEQVFHGVHRPADVGHDVSLARGERGLL